MRYFIHFEQGQHGCKDESGQIFDNDQHAVTEAKIIAGELAGDVQHGRLRVVDATGRHIGWVTISGSQISEGLNRDGWKDFHEP